MGHLQFPFLIAPNQGNYQGSSIVYSPFPLLLFGIPVFQA